MTLAEPPARVRMTECDCFVAAMEALMTRSGQGIHISQSCLVFEQSPDIAALRSAFAELVARHPFITYVAKRRLIPFRAPVMRRHRRAAKSAALGLWVEAGAAGLLTDHDPNQIETAESKQLEWLNGGAEGLHPDGYCGLRGDLIERADGSILFVLSWRHSILDGTGVELLLTDFAEIAAGREPVAPDLDQNLRGAKAMAWHRRWRATLPIVKCFYKLMEKPFHSLGGRKPVPGEARFEVFTLTSEQSDTARKRAAAKCGPLINTPFYLAVAIRAHDQAFRSRSEPPPSYMVSLPAKTRKHGAAGPVFQNHVSMIFFAADGEQIGELEPLSKDLLAQYGDFLKQKLGDSFNQMQHMMRGLPPRLYTSFIRFHMKGEINSFYHSFTGDFAGALEQFFGAPITNAYHIPTVYTPPGSGVFMNERGGRISVTMSWREGVLSEKERELMRAQIMKDLCDAG